MKKQTNSMYNPGKQVDSVSIKIKPFDAFSQSDNKNYNSFVKFMAEMVEKYGNDVLPQLNDSNIK